jgi:methionyl-tRNA formyltransferase
MNKTFIFWGTDEFSVKILETLTKRELEPALIVTVPDKPQGRKNIIVPSPVKVWAQTKGIDILQPPSLRNPDFAEQLKAKGAAFFLVASYGKIIPTDILAIPPKGTLNIHPSLLPKYRGPSPLETAILNGETETGVTIMLVDEEMDHGPILANQKISLRDQYNFERLRNETAVIGANLFADILPDYLAGSLESKVQEHPAATYTKKFTREDGQLNLSATPTENYRKILALNPWPGAYFIDQHNNRQIKVKVKKAKLENGELIFERVIPEGRKEVSWADYLRGKR